MRNFQAFEGRGNSAGANVDQAILGACQSMMFIGPNTWAEVHGERDPKEKVTIFVPLHAASASDVVGFFLDVLNGNRQNLPAQYAFQPTVPNENWRPELSGHTAHNQPNPILIRALVEEKNIMPDDTVDPVIGMQEITGVRTQLPRTACGAHEWGKAYLRLANELKSKHQISPDPKQTHGGKFLVGLAVAVEEAARTLTPPGFCILDHYSTPQDDVVWNYLKEYKPYNGR